MRPLNRSSTSLPCTIEGVSGAHNIAELWRQHYSTILNCVKSDPYKVGNVVKSDTVGITAHEVYRAIAQLADNKASGSDRITAEHLKLASPKGCSSSCHLFYRPHDSWCVAGLHVDCYLGACH